MAKKKTKVEELITVKDFQMWLEGVEAFQEDDWAPNNDQWKLIRLKINLLEASPEVESKPMANNWSQSQSSPRQPVISPPVPSDDKSTLTPSPRKPPQLSSAMNTASPQQMSKKGENGAPGTSTITTKTPVIDTSEGKLYNSPFT